jgi:hypothetical protein
MPRLLRRTAAFLASLALLAVPARGVLACEMGSVTPVASGGEHDHSAMSHHAAAVTQAQPAADAPTDGPSHAPTDQQHPQCDHLVGCAPLALTRSAVLPPDVLSAPGLDVPFVADGAESPARSLEPPPPKR